jgi:DNA-binding MarR family transcriptional regulator
MLGGMVQRNGPQPQASPAVAPVSESRQLTEVVTQLRRALRASIRTEIPWEALPMAQVELLQSLAEAAPARITDLAQRLHLAASTVSGLIAQMIDADLVQRHTDQTDRRAAVVTMTSTGRSQLDAWEQAHEQRISQAYEQLSDRERLAVARALPALSRLTGLLHAEEP